MEKPCRHLHPTYTEGCALCKLWRDDPRVRDKAEKMKALQAKKAPPVKYALPCIALGPLVERRGCACARNDLHRCLKGHGTVSQNKECESCNEYEADD